MSYLPLFPVKIFTAATLSGTASNTSVVVETKYLDNIGIQLEWTGTPNGSFDVQISSDSTVAPGNWISLPYTPAIAPAGSASNGYIDVNQTSAQWMRVVYTNTSGTGTLNGWLCGKKV